MPARLLAMQSRMPDATIFESGPVEDGRYGYQLSDDVFAVTALFRHGDEAGEAASGPT